MATVKHPSDRHKNAARDHQPAAFFMPQIALNDGGAATRAIARAPQR